MRPSGLLLALILSGPSGAAPTEPPDPAAKPTLQVFLNKISATKGRVGALTATAAVTPRGTILIEDGIGVIQVAWGKRIQRVPGVKGLDAFDYASDGVFMGIQRGDLLYLSRADGQFKKLLTLPSIGMGLAIGRGKIYLFERKGDGRKNGLFVLFPGKKSLRLFDSPEPIGAVLEDGDRLLFSVGSSIFEFSADKKTSLVLGQPKGRAIVSLALDPKTRKIYASDGASVFSFKGDQVNMITKESGGTLRWLDGGLLIFDPKAPLLLRIVGLP